ncbi:chemotaxis protein CheW [Candidatus Desantisbacteria bacterium]|nr:chemotaxis protein CheW [Candidatus Desantisbacteria bacterium]
MKQDVQLILFEIEDKEFGLKAEMAREVISCEKITPVPTTPSIISGIIPLREYIVPIVAINKKLCMNLRNDEKNAVLIVEWQGERVGLLIDSVKEILELPCASIEAPSPMLTFVDTNYLDGICKLNDRIIFLVNMDKLLAGEIQRHKGM